MKRKRRKFTDAERSECERLVAAGFRGQRGDVERCQELYETSPDEYKEIGERVRAGIRADLMRRP